MRNKALEKGSMILLNIGCGDRFNGKWVNIDIAPKSPEIQSYDILKGIPYPERYFDAVYASHLLEHLHQDDSKRLVKEIFRVLKYGGIARLVVPDLETIVRIYLEKLEGLVHGNLDLEADYDWMMLELMDQATRSYPGGEMLKFLMNSQVNNCNFVKSRIGTEAEKIWQKKSKDKTFIGKNRWMSQIRNAIAFRFAKCIGGQRFSKSLKEGMYRNSGEVHRWMYDRFSLKRLMVNAGFEQVILCRADNSRIPGFEFFNLDVSNGAIVKPDSLFMEGLKPPKK